MLEEHKRDEGLRHFHRGLALERVNRMSEAVEEYRQAIADYPQLREAHAALGFYYQRAGLLAKAAEKFRAVVNLEGDFLAYFNLGHVLIELQQYEDALEAFHHCFQFQPEDPATHYEVGFIYLSRGEFHRALNHLQLPLRNYPEDWEIHALIGKCHLGLQNYDDALAAFGRALLLVPTLSIQAEILDSMAAVERCREFRTLHSAKDEMYVEEGIVYLGSAQDNGLDVAEVEDYHFTYPDIGVTLQRLLALYQGSRWNFTAVLVVDKVSRPLAEALSILLQAPLRELAELQADDRALLALSVAHEAELLMLALERTPCETVSFCLGVNWLRHSRVLPDLVGIAAHSACSVPWEAELRRLRADGASPEQIAACLQQATKQILQAIYQAPPEKNLSRQVRYYTRNHRRLSFLAT